VCVTPRLQLNAFRGARQAAKEAAGAGG